MDPASVLPHPGSHDPEQDDLEDPWDRISEAGSGVQSGAQDPVPSPLFQSMMAYITHCFPEALGYGESTNRAAPPGAVRPEVEKHIRLTRAQPMDFSLDSASSALLRATEGSRPSLARLPI